MLYLCKQIVKSGNQKMKVSIITVAYNSASTIRYAIDSVLSQTYKDIEYIVVDGDSHDGTQDVIRTFEPKFGNRLRWISEKDSGIYDAMNKGVTMSTGDVVGILNSDDFLTSNTVIEQMVALFPDDAGAVYGDVHFVKTKDLHKHVRYYSGKIFRPWLIRLGFLPPHPSLYVRRELFSKYGFYDTSYKISGDFELIARLCLRYHVPMKYIHLDFVTMRIGGVSTQNFRNRMLGANEDVIACKQNGIKTHRLLIYLKFPIKALESFFIRH